MKAINCWEYNHCDGGWDDLDTAGSVACPVLLFTSADGLNHGTNGGRICWSIAGSFCGGTSEGKLARERFSCMSCNFYSLVEQEEGIDRMIVMPYQLKQFIGEREKSLFTVDKRTHTRTSAILDVQYFHDGVLYYGIATDISERGMCLRHGVTLPRCSTGKLIIYSKPSSVIIPFTVQWAERADNIYNNVMGVEFLRLQNHYTEFIEHQVLDPDLSSFSH